jgi:hypothetical protein
VTVLDVERDPERMRHLLGGRAERFGVIYPGLRRSASARVSSMLVRRRAPEAFRADDEVVLVGLGFDREPALPAPLDANSRLERAAIALAGEQRE